MAIVPFKTFIAGEVLTAADLNASFTKITDNGEDLAWPATKAKDLDGQSLILDNDADTIFSVDADDDILLTIGSIEGVRFNLDTSIPRIRAEYSDSGAAAGPFIDVARISASPATDDDLGRFRIVGKNSAAEDVIYGAVGCEISDAADGSEDGRLQFLGMLSGTLREVFRIGAGFRFIIFDDSTDAAAGPDFVLFRDSASPAANDLGGRIEFDGRDSGGSQTTFAAIEGVLQTVTNGSEDGYLQFEYLRAGSAVKSLSPGIINAADVSLSGTISTITIPANARELHIGFDDASTNGPASWELRLGDAGGVEATGYSAAVLAVDDADQTTESSTTGFLLSSSTGTPAHAGTDTYSGMLTMFLMDPTNNTWVLHGQLQTIDKVHTITGRKSLSQPLTTVNVVPLGFDEFDGGTWNILVK